MKLNNDIDTLFPDNVVVMHNNGRFRVAPIIKSFGAGVELSINDMTSIDSRLPEAIKLMKGDDNYVTGRSVRELLRIWNGSSHFECCDGRLYALFEVYRIGVQPHLIHIFAYGYEVVETALSPCSPDTVLLPSGTSDLKIKTTPAWLDEKYPLWKSSIEAGRSIDLNYTEILRAFVTPAQGASALELPLDLSL